MRCITKLLHLGMETGNKQFKYSIGQTVYQMDYSGDYEIATIIERIIINGHALYLTDLVDKWENETNLK